MSKSSITRCDFLIVGQLRFSETADHVTDCRNVLDVPVKSLTSVFTHFREWPKPTVFTIDKIEKMSNYTIYSLCNTVWCECALWCNYTWPSLDYLRTIMLCWHCMVITFLDKSEVCRVCSEDVKGSSMIGQMVSYAALILPHASHPVWTL